MLYSMKTTTAAVLETCTADYTTIVHYAQRSDGQWFVRYQERTIYGRRWGAWRPTACGPDYSRETGRKARLPAAVAA